MFLILRLEPRNQSQRGARLVFISWNWHSKGSSLFMISCIENDMRKKKGNTTKKSYFHTFYKYDLLILILLCWSELYLKSNRLLPLVWTEVNLQMLKRVVLNFEKNPSPAPVTLLNEIYTIWHRTESYKGSVLTSCIKIQVCFWPFSASSI